MNIPPKVIDYNSLKRLIPHREEHSHKGDFGHVLVIGGDHGYGGAIVMAAEAAARTGAGLVSVATQPENIANILTRRPEIMAHNLEHPSDLIALMQRASVIVIGPGLGQSSWSSACLKLVLEAQAKSNLPMVVDADALNLISQGLCKELIPKLNNWILTPHAGEAARLLECSRQDIQADRVQAATALQERFGGACVLKGARSLISYRDSKRLHIEQCKEGNPGMATGGMGDILSGVIGGLLAQHFSLAVSAKLGVCLHAKSADLVAAENGERGMLATDLPPFIQRLMNP